MEPFTLREGPVAVSYTHLDVYKRQFLLGGHGAGEEQRHPLARQSGQPLFQPGQLAHAPRVDTGAKGNGVIAGEIHPGGLLQGEAVAGKVLRQPLGIALGKACFRGVDVYKRQALGKTSTLGTWSSPPPAWSTTLTPPPWTSGPPAS